MSHCHRVAFSLIAALFFMRCLAAYWLPITTDEAYYISWGKHLAAGYFDHPPMVAFLSLSSLLGHNGLSSRLFTLLAATICALIHWRILGQLGFHNNHNKIRALLIGLTNLAFLASGNLVTPDAGLMLFWYAAISEILVALEKPKHWLSVGILCGLALLSKYTAVLMGLVILVYLLIVNRKTFRNPWLYAGGCCAFLIFLPNIYWNSSNHWTTISFQADHGLGSGHSSKLASPLPPAQRSLEGSKAWLVGQELKEVIVSLTPPVKKVEKPKPPPKSPPNFLEKAGRRLGDFLGSQLAFWGLMLLALAPWRRKPLTNVRIAHHKSQLLAYAAIIPLLFFGSIALFKKVEANWAGMYMISASLWVSPFLIRSRFVPLASGLNVLIFLVVAAHAKYGFLPIQRQKDRILQETSGYPQLTDYLRDWPHPIVADTYQNVAMLRFYLNDNRVSQWPNITRPSQYLLKEEYFLSGTKWLQTSNKFILVTHHGIPPTLPGFEVQEMSLWKDCFSETQLINKENNSQQLCHNTVRDLYLVIYESN